MNKGLLFFIFLTSQLFSQNFTNGYNFNLPWNDSLSQQFLPKFPAVEITDFITINDSGNFAINDKPVRFWGTNFVSDGAFPDKAKTPLITGRLRKMGFNLVRLHHIDNPWSDGSLFDQWDNTRNINPVTLDRMEYLIHHLKQNGVYINMNLNVSRTFKNSDGVENADSLVDFAKGLTIFDPVMIALQKEYASQLLTHVNPYTNKALVDDPVMAMVEFINENSLYRMWRENKLRIYANGGVLTVKHNRMLDSLWLKFLSDKYTTTQNLSAVWNAESSSGSNFNLIKNGNFETIPISTYWIFEKHEGADAEQFMDIVNPYEGIASAKINVKKVTGTTWHLQWKQTSLKILKDSTYTIEFAAKAESPRKIGLTVIRDDAPYTYYGGQDFNITDKWQVYSFTFKASETNNNTRLAFSFNNTIGNYWFDNVTFGRAGMKGLLAGESLELNSVKRINYDECVSFTDARAADQSAFYIKLQDDFYADMKNYLKNTLGVKVPIVGTNWNIGPGDLITQSKMDYIDNHAYWDHPSFPGVPWSATDWVISNQPMVTSKTGQSIADIFAGSASLGKPYTISEINSCFPNRYQTESLIFVTAYSSFHNTDGIMWFDYNGSTDWTSDRIQSFFSIHSNPAMMTLMPSSAYAFRNGFISKAKNTFKLNYTKEFVELLPKTSTTWAPELFPKKAALINSFRNESFNSSIVTDFNTIQEPANPYITDTGEIIWDNNGIISVNTPMYIGLSGFLNNYGGKEIGSLRLVNADQFATVTWVSLTNNSLSTSDRSLLTISTVAQNTGMVWDGNNTVHNSWGGAPTQLKPAKIRLLLNIQADSIAVYPLDPTGKIKVSFAQKYLSSGNNTFDITIDQNHSKSAWFGVEKFGSGIPVSIETEMGLINEFRLEQNYPNPFNNETTFEYFLPERSEIRLSVFDILGKEIAVLYKGIKEQGSYRASWNGNNIDGSSSSGVFFLRLVSENNNQVRKIVMLK